MQKAMLNALLTPHAELKALQDSANTTKLLALQEEYKTYPFGDVWNEYCERCGVPAGAEWFNEIEKYEAEVLSER